MASSARLALALATIAATRRHSDARASRLLIAAARSASATCWPLR
jgi:hypothetical protein